MGKGAPRMGRPRDGRVDEAIAVATRELLAEAGYARLTMDAVAARAGIGKAAIYRRYASKHEMVFAAAIHGESLPIPDTGSLLGDLTELAQTIIGHLTNPAASGALLSLLGEIGDDPVLAERFTRVFVEPELAGNTAVLMRAVRRGELAEVPDTELFHAMFGGTVLAWLFIARRDPHDLPGRLARFAYAALRSPTGSSGPAPRE